MGAPGWHSARTAMVLPPLREATRCPSGIDIPSRFAELPGCVTDLAGSSERSRTGSMVQKRGLTSEPTLDYDQENGFRRGTCPRF